MIPGMEHLFAIRGWVEGDSEIIAGIRALVADTPFATDWHFTSPSVGQHGFAFFGSVVGDGRREAIKQQLERIAKEVKSNFSDIREDPRGYFVVTCLSARAPSYFWRFCGPAFVERPLGDAD